MSASLVGSEMCIRDRRLLHPERARPGCCSRLRASVSLWGTWRPAAAGACLLYTSDAADDM
eukprot:5218530-Alexandrium_andersonii.AAC.1